MFSDKRAVILAAALSVGAACGTKPKELDPRCKIADPIARDLGREGFIFHSEADAMRGFLRGRLSAEDKAVVNAQLKILRDHHATMAEKLEILDRAINSTSAENR